MDHGSEKRPSTGFSLRLPPRRRSLVLFAESTNRPRSSWLPGDAPNRPTARLRRAVTVRLESCQVHRAVTRLRYAHRTHICPSRVITREDAGADTQAQNVRMDTDAALDGAYVC
jgi:hypothetical protein